MPEERQRNLGPQQQSQQDEPDAPQGEQSRGRTPTPEAAQAGAITALQNEVTLLRARMLVDRLELPRMAEDKLESIQSIVLELAEFVPRVTFELYHQDPATFQELVSNIKTRVAQIEIQLVTFTAAVELEYPKISFFQKLAVTLIALVRNSIGEATLMRTLSSQPAKRKALLGAVDQFRTLIAQHSGQVQDVESMITEEINRPVNQKMHELLLPNQEYQTLLHQTRESESDLQRCLGERIPNNEVSSPLKALHIKWVGKDLPYSALIKEANEKMQALIKNAIEARLSHNRKVLADYEKSAKIQAEKELSQNP